MEAHLILMLELLIMTATGESPSITLNYDPTPYEGSNMNITATIHGATEVYSLSWEVIGGDLPASAKNFTYYRDGVVYSVLSLYDLRFNDRGSYKITVQSENGESSAVADIVVKEAPVSCKNNIAVVSSPPSNITTVQGEQLELCCLFRGIRIYDNHIVSSWNVTFSSPQHREVNIHKDVPDLYHFAASQTDYMNCMVTSHLTILNVSLELNGGSVACIESSSPDINGREPLVQSKSTIDVYDYPKVLNITVLPSTSIITVGSNISLLCWIKAPFKGTIVEWQKNGHNITLQHIKVEQGNEILSNVTIVNATQEDNGNYSCRCYYNRSIVTTKETISSNTDTVLVHVKVVDNSASSLDSIDYYPLIGSGVILMVIILLVVAFVCYKVIKKKRNKAGRNCINVHLPTEETLRSPVSATESTPLLHGAVGCNDNEWFVVEQGGQAGDKDAQRNWSIHCYAISYSLNVKWIKSSIVTIALVCGEQGKSVRMVHTLYDDNGIPITISLVSADIRATDGIPSDCKFILHQSVITEANNKEVYCIECCKPQGYYLQWNDDPAKMSVHFHVPPTQPVVGASSPPPQPPSDEQSIYWLKTAQHSSESGDSHGDLSTLTANNVSDNCYLTFNSSSSSLDYANARLTSNPKDANQMTITENCS